MSRSIGILLCLTALLAGCGSTKLTLSEYAEQVEGLVAEMSEDFAELDAQWLSAPPDMERAREYWEGRLEIREEFLGEIDALNPPERLQTQHDAALDVFGRITAADQALSAAVATWASIDEHWQWVDTPEGRAADAILEEVYAFCRSSQAEFDATGDGEAFEETPWLSNEIEVVKVAFGCPPAASG